MTIEVDELAEDPWPEHMEESLGSTHSLHNQTFCYNVCMVSTAIL